MKDSEISKKAGELCKFCSDGGCSDGYEHEKILITLARQDERKKVLQIIKKRIAHWNSCTGGSCDWSRIQELRFIEADKQKTDSPDAHSLRSVRHSKTDDEIVEKAYLKGVLWSGSNKTDNGFVKFVAKEAITLARQSERQRVLGIVEKMKPSCEHTFDMPCEDCAVSSVLEELKQLIDADEVEEE